MQIYKIYEISGEVVHPAYVKVDVSAKIDRRWRKLAAAGEKYPKMPKYGEEKVKTIHPKRGLLIRGDSGPKS